MHFFIPFPILVIWLPNCPCLWPNSFRFQAPSRMQSSSSSTSSATLCHTEWNACTPSAACQLSASANKSNIIPPGGQKLELSLALSKSALISTFYNPSIPLVTYGAAFSTTNRHLCPYLIFVFSFTQAGFSNSKFYT